MAYDTNILFKRAIELIKADEDIVFIEDVHKALGISVSTFYSHFPTESKESKAIWEELMKNKVSIMKGMRRNWKDANASPTLQLSLYKMIASKEHREILNGTPPEKDKSDTVIRIEGFIPLKKDD